MAYNAAGEQDYILGIGHPANVPDEPDSPALENSGGSGNNTWYNAKPASLKRWRAAFAKTRLSSTDPLRLRDILMRQMQ